jgi:hypothetical protein
LAQGAAVAQWIEYWPPKPRVVGSIPASRTNRPFFDVSQPLKMRWLFWKGCHPDDASDF